MEQVIRNHHASPATIMPFGDGPFQFQFQTAHDQFPVSPGGLLSSSSPFGSLPMSSFNGTDLNSLTLPFQRANTAGATSPSSLVSSLFGKSPNGPPSTDNSSGIHSFNQSLLKAFMNINNAKLSSPFKSYQQFHTNRNSDTSNNISENPIDLFQQFHTQNQPIALTANSPAANTSQNDVSPYSNKIQEVPDSQLLAQALLVNPNFAAASALITAMSSSSNSSMMSVCTPLLQAAIRQALATTSVRNRVELCNSTSPELQRSPDTASFPSFACSPRSNDMEAYSTETRTALTTSSTPTTSYSSASSRRKPSNPCRFIDSASNDALAGNAAINLSPTRLTDTNELNDNKASMPFDGINGQYLQHNASNMAFSGQIRNENTTYSCETSPSVDSGVLDLSRAGSLAGSAPMTPAKQHLSLPHMLGLFNDATFDTQPRRLTEDSAQHGSDTSALQASLSLLELYQRQLAIQTCTSSTPSVSTPATGRLCTSGVMPLNLSPPCSPKEYCSNMTSSSSSCTNNSALFNNFTFSKILGGTTCSSVSSEANQRLKLPLTPKMCSAPNSPAKRQRISNSSARQTNTLKTKSETFSGSQNCESTHPMHSGQPSSISSTNVVRRHNSTRSFPCNQCGDRFPSLHTLEQHTLSRHGSYRCHVCKAQFTQRSNLQRHALKHVGFKPFECRVCEKAYFRKDHLMRHMEMSHPGFAPRDHITVHLTSSESLEFLNKSKLAPLSQHGGSTSISPSPSPMQMQSEMSDEQAELKMVLNNEVGTIPLHTEVTTEKFEFDSSVNSKNFSDDNSYIQDLAFNSHPDADELAYDEESSSHLIDESFSPKRFDILENCSNSR